MTIFASRRFIITLILAIAGALLAAQIAGYWSRVLAILMVSMIAIVIISDEGVNSSRKHRDGYNKDLLNPINDHPEFQLLINSIKSPLLIISKNRVLAANLSALQLLGSPLVGQNIAGAFRHSVIIEKLTKFEHHDDENISISGLGQREQRWDMHVIQLNNQYRIVQLLDKSINHAAEKMRVDFVANASHELLTPLASIKGFIETLNDDSAGGDSKTRHKFLSIIGDEAQRMELLIRDLMSLSRIESGTFADIAKEVSFIEIVNQAINGLVKGSNKRGKDIVLNAKTDLPRVAGDEGQLRQMVINIVANSMKYAKTDTPIEVTIDKIKSGSMVRFCVRDYGNGIASEHIPRLTERFYRVDSGRSKALGGTGLGLSLVKHIVQRHRGHMDISSTINDGTKITILLPVAAADHDNIRHTIRPRRTIEEDT